MASTPPIEYTPDRKGMRRLMQDPRLAQVLTEAAKNAQAYAEGIAPRETGTYAGSFEIETRIVGDRQTAVLFNRVKYATVLEVKHRVLGRAVDRAKP